MKKVGFLDLFSTQQPYGKVWRWTTKGVRGVRLEKAREGGRIITSVEAVERFLEATQ